jgi:hypothetical protein
MLDDRNAGTEQTVMCGAGWIVRVVDGRRVDAHDGNGRLK